MNNIEEFERKKEILLKNRASAIENLEEAKKKYEKIKNDENVDKKEIRLEIAFNNISSRKWILQQIEDKIELLRPSNQEDIDYRQRQYDEFDRRIKDVVPDDLHLCFHGCPVYIAKYILDSGEISSSVDRIGKATSYDVEDQVSVTTKNTIETTIRGYSDLSGNYELPAGCVFVIKPKDEAEIKSSETSMLIGNVSFKDNPERLYGIITTPENIERINQWAKDANIDLSKIYDYDGFIREMENNREQNLFSEQDIGKRIRLISTDEKDKAKNAIEKQNEKENERNIE